MSFHQAMPWHEGEEAMHTKLRVPEMDNPTVPMLSPQAANMLQRAPLLAIGTIDDDGTPWTTVWGGTKGFSQPLGNSIIGVRTSVAVRSDPVVEILLGKEANGEVVRQDGKGRMVAGLSIDLETRKRVKIQGRMIAGALAGKTDETVREGSDDSNDNAAQGELQLVIRVDQSLGNCPKYLNKKEICPSVTEPRLLSTSTVLGCASLSLLATSDLFFMSTCHNTEDMDTNHRGGAPGFVRVLSNTTESTVLVYPEYSGNRLYQSLGNLITNPRVGLCFPDFDSGDCLYVSGTAEILIGHDASSVLPRSNLAVKIVVTAVRHVACVLPFRGSGGELSPYNPTVRYLRSERKPTRGEGQAHINTARLLKQIPITPTISRFAFSLTNPMNYTAGQYVTLDFSDHLDLGYSHMRDDDPRSLNDDFVRTFTVSSPPGLPARPDKKLSDDEFEITIRRVGVVTDLLFKHGLGQRRPGTEFEVEVKGFGGNFQVQQDSDTETVGFIAGGIGITPLLPCIRTLDISKLTLLWSIRMEDVGLVVTTLELYPVLAKVLKLFITTRDPAQSLQHNDDFGKVRDYLYSMHVEVAERRMQKHDIEYLQETTKRVYICTSTPHRLETIQWWQGPEMIYEDFNY